MDHACAACGGSGLDTPEPHVYDGAGFTFDQWSAAIRALPQCPVCLGSGRISDRMPAKDALADAETLERVADESLERPAFGIQQALWRAGAFGHAALLPKALLPPLRGALDFAFERGVLAARAAFRAVPGLRGE